MTKIHWQDVYQDARVFLTFCGGAPIIGQRMRPDPRDRVALKLVRESDAGVVIRGKVGMHRSPAYAEDVYIGALCGIEIGGHRASFIVPVNAAGVTTLCRKVAARDSTLSFHRSAAAMTSSTARCGSMHPGEPAQPYRTRQVDGAGPTTAKRVTRLTGRGAAFTLRTPSSGPVSWVHRSVSWTPKMGQLAKVEPCP
jgi:hypothetical protein